MAPDVVYVEPRAVFDGPAGLSEAFERLRRADRQPAALRRTSAVDQHHGYFRFTWERVERGTVVMSGWIFGSLDESGAIDRIVAFEGLEPGRPGGLGSRAADAARLWGGTLTVVLVEVAEGIGTITLNRPEARNAISGQLTRELDQAITDLDAREDVACIVLTGADPAFCAGVDLKALASEPREDQMDRQSGPIAHFGFLPPHETPVIGAINGATVTGGLEIALNCDFLIASERARFADTHARVGAMPGAGPDHPPAAADRRRPGPAHELHGRLHRRRDRPGLGPRGRGGAARAPARAGPRDRGRRGVDPAGTTCARSGACTTPSARSPARRPGGPSRTGRAAGCRSASTSPASPPSARTSWPGAVPEHRTRQPAGVKVYAGMDPRLSLPDVIAHAQRVERLGYDGLHVAETVHDAMAVALLAAEHTERITVRTSVALAFTRSPTLLAYAAWDIAKLSGGRFQLGLGTQIRQNIEDRYGVAFRRGPDRPAARLRRRGARRLRLVRVRAWRRPTRASTTG